MYRLIALLITFSFASFSVLSPAADVQFGELTTSNIFEIEEDVKVGFDEVTSHKFSGNVIVLENKIGTFILLLDDQFKREIITPPPKYS